MSTRIAVGTVVEKWRDELAEIEKMGCMDLHSVVPGFFGTLCSMAKGFHQLVYLKGGKCIDWAVNQGCLQQYGTPLAVDSLCESEMPFNETVVIEFAFAPNAGIIRRNGCETRDNESHPTGGQRTIGLDNGSGHPAVRVGQTQPCGRAPEAVAQSCVAQYGPIKQCFICVVHSLNSFCKDNSFGYYKQIVP